jgi:hypothetical protein
MTSTFTTNKSIEKPANGDYVNDWNVPVNADWDIIDKAFGGITTLNVTGQSSTPVTLTSTQYIPLILNITGTLTANVTYTIPSGIGGQWIAANNTTGAYTVTISSGGAGSSYVIPQGYRTVIASDGTNIVLSNNLPPTPGGSNTQIQYNSSGSLVGSSNLTFDGTNVTNSAGTFIDNIGLSRSVPINNQTVAYTVASSDAGKIIVSTGANIAINTSVLGIGQNVTYFNNSSSTTSIVAGSGVTIYLVGFGSTGTRTVGPYGIATLISIATDTYIITGNSLS